MLSHYLKWVFTVSISEHTLRINLDKSTGYQDQCLCKGYRRLET